MQWKTPEFVEIDMNAEIGGYQQDPGDGSDPDRVTPAEAEEALPPADAARTRPS